MIQVSHLPLGAPKITEVRDTKTSGSCKTGKRVQTRPSWFSYHINLARGAEEGRLCPCPALMDSISLPHLAL